MSRFHSSWIRIRKASVVLIASGVLVGSLSEQVQAEESLGGKIRKIFAPTPTPSPRKHRKSSTASKASKTESEPTPSPGSSRKKKRGSQVSPTPTPAESASPPATPNPEGEEAVTSLSPSSAKKKKVEPAPISTKNISGFADYPEKVRQLIESAAELTTRNLGYNYGSADPAGGGMDCSGFVYYVLAQNGIRDVPRDSSQQYVWLRKSGNFRAVNSRHEDTFELDELVPGDLLFWTGTYEISRDPPITHVMIYLGRELGTNQRVMVGASDGRTYHGESRYGVSVFDFKITPSRKTDEGRRSPSFIGYGHIPGV